MQNKQNKQIYIDFILDCFIKGLVERGEVMATFGKEWQKPTRTFDRYYKTAKEQFRTYQDSINNAKLDQSIKSEKQAVKNGLKTKFDRLMILQNQVDTCLDQLTSRQCDDFYFKDFKPMLYKRNMNQRELNDTRKTLNILQVEISKIEGDYAVLKSEVKTEGTITTTFINFQGKDIPI